MKTIDSTILASVISKYKEIFAYNVYEATDYVYSELTDYLPYSVRLTTEGTDGDSYLMATYYSEKLGYTIILSYDYPLIDIDDMLSNIKTIEYYTNKIEEIEAKIK